MNAEGDEGANADAPPPPGMAVIFPPRAVVFPPRAVVFPPRAADAAAAVRLRMAGARARAVIAGALAWLLIRVWHALRLLADAARELPSRVVPPPDLLRLPSLTASASASGSTTARWAGRTDTYVRLMTTRSASQSSPSPSSAVRLAWWRAVGGSTPAVPLPGTAGLRARVSWTARLEVAPPELRHLSGRSAPSANVRVVYDHAVVFPSVNAGVHRRGTRSFAHARVLTSHDAARRDDIEKRLGGVVRAPPCLMAVLRPKVHRDDVDTRDITSEINAHVPLSDDITVGDLVHALATRDVAIAAMLERLPDDAAWCVSVMRGDLTEEDVSGTDPLARVLVAGAPPPLWSAVPPVVVHPHPPPPHS